jgi:hypothetical protein
MGKWISFGDSEDVEGWDRHWRGSGFSQFLKKDGRHAHVDHTRHEVGYKIPIRGLLYLPFYSRSGKKYLCTPITGKD